MSFLASLRTWRAGRRQRELEEYAENHPYDPEAHDAAVADEQRRQEEAAEHAFRATRDTWPL